jgi:mRNA-degrading endonuclease toxin of MazEF toxin-antitoxin module
MQKTSQLYDDRNQEKQRMEFSSKKKEVVPWQLWICKIGVNIWSEISKDLDFSRPVLILKTNLWGDVVTIIPLTSKFHAQHAYQYIYFEDRKKYGLALPSYFLLNQVKTISIKRLTRRINDIGKIQKVPYIYRKDLEQKIIKYMFSS